MIVVGSGAGGMVAALSAASAGLRPVILERSEWFGGTSAISGGSVWVPNAPQMRAAGVSHDRQRLIDYMSSVAGNSVATARVERYVDAAAAMMAFLESSSPYLRDGFVWMRGYPDYFPERGGSPEGWGLQARPIDRRKLGAEAVRLRTGMARIPGVPRGMWITGEDLHSINQIRWGVGLEPYRTLGRLLWRTLRSRVLGEQMAANGAALMARLRLALIDHDVPIFYGTQLASLFVEDGAVRGVVSADGRQWTARAVILATGGFSHNAEMRSAHQPDVPLGWSLASPDDMGDGHRAAQELGAACGQLDEAWWYPVADLPDGPGRTTAERQYPGQFIVGKDGARFCNEAIPYTEFGRIQLRTGNVPAWMITDQRAMRRNILFAHFPTRPVPRNWIDSGLVKRANTIEELAELIGVPADSLRNTATRFNEMARAGRDADFHRGESIYQNYYGNPTLPNPNLEPVDSPPFYAFAFYPGDIGTNGGLITDENARVLRHDGSVIEGLFACGNVTASVMGLGYAGLGATIGAAMTFGWVAAQKIAQSFG